MVLEAMTCKIPVVATNCPSGIGEIINEGITGFLVENDNADELKRIILQYLDNPSLARKIAERAFEEVKK